MNSGEVIINSKQSLESYKAFLDRQFEKDKYLRVTLKTGKQRSLTENGALHLFCTQLAEAMNDAGFDFRVFVKEGYPVKFTPELVKDYIWRPIQKAITGHESTKKAERGQYSEVYDALNLKLAEYGIHIPWPSKDRE